MDSGGGTIMKLLVLIERLAWDSFRARTGEPLALTAEGTSSDDALRKLLELVSAKLCAGAQLTEITIPVTEARSWPPPPIFDPDDPLVEQWIETMKENRRKNDEDPDYL
jgi:hypothetical protein